MKVTFKNSAIVFASLILAACGSSDNASSDDEHEHEHTLLISHQESVALSVLDEGVAESLGVDKVAEAYAAELLLSNTGEQAAVITANKVQFVAAHHEEEKEEEAHEEEELPELSTLEVSSTAQPIVVNTKGHFSVLVDGATQLVPYESLEEGETPVSESLGLGIAEEYPAFVLEEDALVIAFSDDTVAVYEDEGLGDGFEVGTSYTCEDVKSAAHTTLVEEEGEGVFVQVADFVVVSCDNSGTAKNYKFELVHDTDTLTEAEFAPTISTLVEWKIRASVFVGLGDDDKFYVAEEDHGTGALEQVNAEGFAEPVNMCEDLWAIDSTEADIFALATTDSTDAVLTIYDHTGSSHSITLDETASTTQCSDLRMATANNAVFVMDNVAGKLYEIDKEEDASEYHIHGREDLSVDDVASAVVFHEAGSEADHDHYEE